MICGWPILPKAALIFPNYVIRIGGLGLAVFWLNLVLSRKKRNSCVIFALHFFSFITHREACIDLFGVFFYIFKTAIIIKCYCFFKVSPPYFWEIASTPGALLLFSLFIFTVASSILGQSLGFPNLLITYF